MAKIDIVWIWKIDRNVFEKSYDPWDIVSDNWKKVSIAGKDFLLDENTGYVYNMDGTSSGVREFMSKRLLSQRKKWEEISDFRTQIILDEEQDSQKNEDKDIARQKELNKWWKETAENLKVKIAELKNKNIKSPSDIDRLEQLEVWLQKTEKSISDTEPQGEAFDIARQNYRFQENDIEKQKKNEQPVKVSSAEPKWEAFDTAKQNHSKKQEPIKIEWYDRVDLELDGKVYNTFKDPKTGKYYWGSWVQDETLTKIVKEWKPVAQADWKQKDMKKKVWNPEDFNLVF